MANNYYNFTGGPFIPGTKARSDQVNTEYQAIVSAFDLLPTSTSAIVLGTATFAGTTGGSGNAYTVTMPDTRLTNQNGDEVVFIADRTNTGAATLNVDGIGAVSIVRGDATALAAGDLTAGRVYAVRFVTASGHFQLMVPTKNAVISAEEAAVSAAAAADSATEAYHWAQYPEDSLVPEGDLATEYSAYHWALKAEGWAAGVNLPSASGQALKFLRQNAAETGLEYYNLFDSYNVWTKNQAWKDNVSQTILQVIPGSATYDDALNGMIVYKSDNTPRGFFGSIPNSTANYFNIWVWNDTLGTPAWNAAIGVARDSVVCQFHSTGLLVDGSEVTRESRANTFSAANTFSGNNTFSSDNYFTGNVQFLMNSNPMIGFLETDTTNTNWSVEVEAGNLRFVPRNDVWTALGNYPVYFGIDTPTNSLVGQPYGISMANGAFFTGAFGATPSGGAGVKIWGSSGIGYLQGYSHSISDYISLDYDAADHYFRIDGTLKAYLTANDFYVYNWLRLIDPSASMGFDNVTAPDSKPFKRITCNDGAGNWNFRAGEYYDTTLKWAQTSSGSAAVVLSFESQTGTVDLHTSDDASAVAGNAIGTFGAQYLQYGTGNHNFLVGGTSKMSINSSGVTIDDLFYGQWSGGASLSGISHNSGGTNNYLILSDGTQCYVSAAGSGGNVYLRPGLNDSTNQMIVQAAGYLYRGKFQDRYSAAKTAAESVTSSTTMQNDDHLSLTDLDIGYYRIRIGLRISSGLGLGGLRFQINGNYSTTLTYGTTHAVDDGGSVFDRSGTLYTATGQAFTLISNNGYILVDGFVYVNAGSGSIYLQWAQNTSNATATTIAQGSFISLERVQ